jgi:hypothetical protein
MIVFMKVWRVYCEVRTEILYVVYKEFVLQEFFKERFYAVCSTFI